VLFRSAERPVAARQSFRRSSHGPLATGIVAIATVAVGAGSASAARATALESEIAIRSLPRPSHRAPKPGPDLIGSGDNGGGAADLARDPDLPAADGRHPQFRPAFASHRLEVCVDGPDQRREIDAAVRRKVRAKVGGAAAPLVDRAAPVAPTVVETRRRDLDQALVERSIGTRAHGRPVTLPRFVRVPVASGVEELDALGQPRLG